MVLCVFWVVCVRVRVCSVMGLCVCVGGVGEMFGCIFFCWVGSGI